jgi:CRISPR/Cas system-associated protein Csx1
MIFLLFAFLLCGCLLKTKSGNAAFNRNIAITALSGNAYIHISGRISEDIYLNHSGEERAWDKNIIETPIVVQGTETIDQHILLYESQEFKYTLTIAEVVIMNIRSIDGNDVRLLVQEYGKNKEYTISGKNKQGKMISFKN